MVSIPRRNVSRSRGATYRESAVTRTRSRSGSPVTCTQNLQLSSSSPLWGMISVSARAERISFSSGTFPTGVTASTGLWSLTQQSGSAPSSRRFSSAGS
jgi:hypothetical protein